MASQQLRSTSLPLRPHALVQELEDELQRIRSGAAASSASAPSPAALATRLGDAYGRVEELVGLPGGRDALSGARWRRAVEHELDASVAVLDLCQRARDAAASARQHVRAARCALRRGDAAAAKAAMRGYARCLAKAGKQSGSSAKKRAPATTEATPAAVRVLSEAVAVTAAVLQRAMASLSARAAAADTRRSRWCAVSKLLLLPRGERSLGVCKEMDGDDGVVRAQEMLEELEDSIDGVESGLEHLFRHIVRSRVALLNVLTL